MTEFQSFSPALFDFLADLEAHNEREWFNKNKARYEAEVRGPALAFVRAMAPRLAQISEELLAVDKKVGGSLMRIYRDTRFSKDKTPYKTNVGLQFRHRAGKDVHAPGVYVHIDNDSCFLGVGMWMPPNPELNKIRALIDAEPDRWRSITQDSDFTETFALEGTSLKRIPRGYDKDHPLADDLRRKSHIAVHRCGVDVVTSPEFPAWVEHKTALGAPFMAFLCDAMGQPF